MPAVPATRRLSSRRRKLIQHSKSSRNSSKQHITVNKSISTSAVLIRGLSRWAMDFNAGAHGLYVSLVFLRSPAASFVLEAEDLRLGKMLWPATYQLSISKRRSCRSVCRDVPQLGVIAPVPCGRTCRPDSPCELQSTDIPIGCLKCQCTSDHKQDILGLMIR